LLIFYLLNQFIDRKLLDVRARTRIREPNRQNRRNDYQIDEQHLGLKTLGRAIVSVIIIGRRVVFGRHEKNSTWVSAAVSQPKSLLRLAADLPTVRGREAGNPDDLTSRSSDNGKQTAFPPRDVAVDQPVFQLL